jgi:hypothetical protein
MVDAPSAAVSTSFLMNLLLSSLSLGRDHNKTKKTERNKNSVIKSFKRVSF